jgi:hypothetical protein
MRRRTKKRRVTRKWVAGKSKNALPGLLHSEDRRIGLGEIREAESCLFSPSYR